MSQASGHSEEGAWGSIVLGCLVGGSDASSLLSVAGLSSAIALDVMMRTLDTS